MNPKTFIFVGRSGCGKGTQAELLMEYVKEHDSSKREIFYLETGKKFREFIEQDNFTSKLSRVVYNSGRLQPSFLAAHIWSHILINDFKGDEHLFIDGTPRTEGEAVVLDSAFRFYERELPAVIFLNVGHVWSKQRLMGRGRFDDKNEADVDKRLSWFDTDVMPAIVHMKESRLYDFYEINGEQSVEAVQAEIMQKLGSKIL